MLSNADFLAKFRFGTAENEPAKNLQNFRKNAFSKSAFSKNAFSKNVFSKNAFSKNARPACMNEHREDLVHRLVDMMK